MAGRRDAAYLLYDWLLHLVGLVALPFALSKALFSARARAALRQRMGFGTGPGLAPGCLLLHGVSVGEVSAMRPLVRILKDRHPGLPLAISSTTQGGRETAERLFPELPVLAFPVDLSYACRRFLKRIAPRGVILMELEIWPNFLRVCDRMGVAVAIVNGRITERSLRGYRRVQRLLPQFDRIRVYGVQNQRYAARFRQLAVPPDRIHVTGNLKFDIPTDKVGASPKACWNRWVGNRPSVVFGSTHEPEESLLLQAFEADSSFAEVLFLVVPRHPERGQRLRRVLQDLLPRRRILLRSQVEEEPLPAGAVLVVDSFGELESAYRVARVAFVGGSLIPHGGQNVLEPAALRRPILVGPHTENFVDEVELLAGAGALRRGDSASVLVGYAREWLRDPAAAQAAGAAGAAALEGRRGAAAATLRLLESSGILS